MGKVVDHKRHKSQGKPSSYIFLKYTTILLPRKCKNCEGRKSEDVQECMEMHDDPDHSLDKEGNHLVPDNYESKFLVATPNAWAYQCLVDKLAETFKSVKELRKSKHRAEANGKAGIKTSPGKGFGMSKGRIKMVGNRRLIERMIRE